MEEGEYIDLNLQELCQKISSNSEIPENEVSKIIDGFISLFTLKFKL